MMFENGFIKAGYEVRHQVMVLKWHDMAVYFRDMIIISWYSILISQYGILMSGYESKRGPGHILVPDTENLLLFKDVKIMYLFMCKIIFIKDVVSSSS